MNKTAKRYPAFLVVLTAALILAGSVLFSGTVHAATLISSRPKLTTASAYNNSYVYLKWTKVSGAKKYEIYRAKVIPADEPTEKLKLGAWKKWAATKNTYVKRKDSGDYKYRVRAVNGKKTSKWSVAKRVFAANAKITHMGYTEPEYMFGVLLSSGGLEFRVLVTNKTKSDMGFVTSGTRFDPQGTLYAVNKKTGKVLKKWEADLDLPLGSIAKVVQAGKSQSLYFDADISSEDWAKYKNSKFLFSCSFYPNPEVEPLTTQMAFTCSKSVKDSSLAAK